MTKKNRQNKFWIKIKKHKRENVGEGENAKLGIFLLEQTKGIFRRTIGENIGHVSRGESLCSCLFLFFQRRKNLFREKDNTKFKK